MKCCELYSGKLRNLIDIERAVETPDGAGGNSKVWQVIASPRAYIKPISGGERFQAMRLESNISHRIFIRYRSDLKSDDRINYQGRLMQIKAIVNIEEQNKWLEIYAVEGQST